MSDYFYATKVSKVTIGNTIRQLLEEGKKVILPGFGNLEVIETGLGAPTSGKRIDPPGSIIRFDNSYSKDDSLVASTFAANASMDPEEAGQQVLELVDAIKFALDKGEPWAVEGAGTFSRDDDGKVHFQPEKGWVLEPDQYGLESVDLLELDDEPEVKEAVEQPEEKEKVPEQEALDEKVPPVSLVSPKPATAVTQKTTRSSAPVHEPWKAEKKSKSGVNLWKIIWIVAGSLVVILLALILIPSDKLQVFEGKDGTEQPAAGEHPAGTVTEGSSQGDMETVDSEKPVVSEPEQSTPAEDLPPEHKYFLIAGSFKHLGYASELQDKLKARGYHAEVMVTENRMYRVSVSSYATKVEAERELSRIKSVPGLESCWLLSNE